MYLILLSLNFLGGTEKSHAEQQFTTDILTGYATSRMYVCTRAVWKVRRLAAVRRFYAEGGGDSYAKL
jgi:hypothetical protein